jgi:hypothetical protein
MSFDKCCYCHRYLDLGQPCPRCRPQAYAQWQDRQLIATLVLGLPGEPIQTAERVYTSPIPALGPITWRPKTDDKEQAQ